MYGESAFFGGPLSFLLFGFLTNFHKCPDDPTAREIYRRKCQLCVCESDGVTAHEVDEEWAMEWKGSYRYLCEVFGHLVK